ncbi:MAG: hypothetical protein JRI25_11115 [Deltaproteobacteria bacterium]|nr:hypothetical protein [Deltaproteobacteria bacterium]MBW2255135.1 hypothetical protein [Deltaproteobacteria bacterium]
MIRHLTLFACLTVLGSACGSKSAQDVEARVDALEARYHTQDRLIKELTEDVTRLKTKERRRAERVGAIRKHRKDLREGKLTGSAQDTDDLLDLFDVDEEEAPQEPAPGSEPAQ